MKKARVLISGFEPFMNIKVNPSEVLVKSFKDNLDFNIESLFTNNLAQKLISNFSLPSRSLELLLSMIDWHFAVLPVDYKSSFLTLDKELKAFKPDVVLALGVAADRSTPTLERIAINHHSSNLLDNLGYKPASHKIVENGPDGIFCNFDIEGVVRTLAPLESMKGELAESQSSLRLKVSNTAGTYLCNSVMYQLLLEAKKENFLAGFLHVPDRTDEESIQSLQKTVLLIVAFILLSQRE